MMSVCYCCINLSLFILFFTLFYYVLLLLLFFFVFSYNEKKIFSTVVLTCMTIF